MAVIVKCDPASLSPGESLNATVAFYGGIRPHLHEPALVWFSETAGGGGLAWRGQINSLSANDTKQVSLSVRLEAAPERPLGKADLEPHRDQSENPVLGSLSGKLYRHALNKVAGLTLDEENYLNTFFGN